MSRALALLLLVATTVGCSADPADDAGPADPAVLAWHRCPDATEIALPTDHRCGTLTVPVDHDRRSATLDLAVVQVWPGAYAGGDDTVALSVGFDLGDPRQAPGDLHLLAERIGVPVVSLSPRGVGDEGGTSLDCPELRGTGAETLDQPDTAARQAFVDGVVACRERLTGEGVDLDRFGSDDIARDLEALRVGLELEEWYVLVSYGTMSRVTDAYVAEHPSRVRAVVEDSPAPHGRSLAALGSVGLESALDALFEECEDDRRCARRYPGLAATWEQAVDRVGRQPLTGPSDEGPVTVDEPRFVRGVHAVLGHGPGPVGDLPRVITMAADGVLHPALAAQAAKDPDLCLGHRPVCVQTSPSVGAHLSQLCPEAATTASGGEATPGEVAYAEACRVWDVEHVAPAPAPEVPTLVITGHLDSWSRPEWFDDPLVVRGARHDVASSSRCVFDVRNPWIEEPSTAVDHSRCDDEPFPAWD